MVHLHQTVQIVKMVINYKLINVLQTVVLDNTWIQRTIPVLIVQKIAMNAMVHSLQTVFLVQKSIICSIMNVLKFVQMVIMVTITNV